MKPLFSKAAALTVEFADSVVLLGPIARLAFVALASVPPTTRLDPPSLPLRSSDMLPEFVTPPLVEIVAPFDRVGFPRLLDSPVSALLLVVEPWSAMNALGPARDT